MADNDYIQIGDEYVQVVSDTEDGVVLEVVELPSDVVRSIPTETPTIYSVETPYVPPVETPTIETPIVETPYVPPLETPVQTPIEPPTPQAQQIPTGPSNGELPIQPIVSATTIKDRPTGNTISFSERSKGWVSFKTIDPEIGFSLNNEYYTAKNGIVWKHHDDSVDRNSLYNASGTITDSSYITVLFNDLPSVIKSFTTLNYEGSQSKIVENLADNKHYNNQPELGWYVNSIITDQQTGTVTEFINKEGKWFNYIIGEETTWKNGSVLDGGIAPVSGADGNLDTKEFSTQGIGILVHPPVITQ